jgi:hypothetical protein
MAMSDEQRTGRAIVACPYGNGELDHTVELTGHTQQTPAGKLYREGRRTDNGLFEMIPDEWLSR